MKNMVSSISHNYLNAKQHVNVILEPTEALKVQMKLVHSIEIMTDPCVPGDVSTSKEMNGAGAVHTIDTLYKKINIHLY